MKNVEVRTDDGRLVSNIKQRDRDRETDRCLVSGMSGKNERNDSGKSGKGRRGEGAAGRAARCTAKKI